MNRRIEDRQRMGFKQPSVEEHPQADVLTGVPTLVTIVDVDLTTGSVVSQAEENKKPRPKSSGSQPEPTPHPSPSI